MLNKVKNRRRWQTEIMLGDASIMVLACALIYWRGACLLIEIDINR